MTMKERLALLFLFPLILLGLFLTVVRYLYCLVRNTEKSWHIALMVDELANVDANGRVNQTISSRAALARKSGRTWGCVLCKVLDYIQRGHRDNSLPR